jgi:hypothetical protein
MFEMKKMVLAFPTKADMAEFVLDRKINQVEVDRERVTLTGYFLPECIDKAIKKYGAYIPIPPDFIIPQ